MFPYVAQVVVGIRDKLRVFGGDFDTLDGTGSRDYVHVMDLGADIYYLQSYSQIYRQSPSCHSSPGEVDIPLQPRVM